MVLLLDQREQFGRSAGQGAAAARQGHMATVRGQSGSGGDGWRTPSSCGVPQRCLPLAAGCLLVGAGGGREVPALCPTAYLVAPVCRAWLTCRCSRQAWRSRRGHCPLATRFGWPAAGGWPSNRGRRGDKGRRTKGVEEGAPKGHNLTGGCTRGWGSRAARACDQAPAAPQALGSVSQAPQHFMPLCKCTSASRGPSAGGGPLTSMCWTTSWSASPPTTWWAPS